MDRWTKSDADESRLPEGMKRIGYDADLEIYKYQDDHGDIWEGQPGEYYGAMRKVRNTISLPSATVIHAEEPPPEYTPHDEPESSPRSLSHSDSTSSLKGASSPSYTFRAPPARRPDPFSKPVKVDLGRPPATTFDEIVPPQKQAPQLEAAGNLGRQRAVPSPMNIMRRAASVVSKTALRRTSPKRSEVSYEAIKSDPEKQEQRRRRKDGGVQRHPSLQQNLERRKAERQDTGFGRRGTVKW